MKRKPLGSPAVLDSRRLRSLPLLATTLAVAAFGCSGGGGSTGTAPTPKVASVTVTPPSASVVFGATLQLSASAATSTGAAVTGITTSWSSSSNAVATVSSSGLVTGAGPGTATITATMGGVNGNASLTVTVVPFSPTTSMSLGGLQHFASLNIPVGVTLTAIADLNVIVDSAATVSGKIAGDCVMLHLTASGALTATGNISNVCSQGSATPPDMRLVGSSYALTDTITAAGNVLITNDTTLTATAADALQLFARRPAAAATAASAAARASVIPTLAPAATNTPQGCSLTGTVYAADGVQGAGGLAGKPGTNGGTISLRCTGDLLFNAIGYGGNGGRGGAGSDVGSNPAALASGGRGGNGGGIYLIATGNLLFGGAVRLYPGSGGDGGGATASSTVAGATATATGGPGGSAGPNGLLTLSAGTKMSSVALVVLEIPGAGQGGDAMATGSKGADASLGTPPQKGGAATATGGDAGITSGSFVISAPTNTATFLPVQPGVGAKARGGNGTAKSGLGGNGDAINIDGADGGPGTAIGGAGETSTMTYLGQLLRAGGDGGTAELDWGSGGTGTADCVAGSATARGGNGGNGGAGAGHGGLGGTGFANGQNSPSYAFLFGYGANGQKGVPSGTGGTGGKDNRTGTALKDGLSFGNGNAGPSCAISLLNGTYTGAANLASNSSALSGAPMSVLSLATCAGSQNEYSESIAVSFGANGSGSVSMVDTPSFQRAYNGMVSGLSFMSSGSFPFLGPLIPGWLGVTFSADGKSATFSETTNWGTCANTYGGTVTKP